MILFAGIEINDSSRDLCVTLQKYLRGQTVGSFPARENFHVTLAYFGDVDEQTKTRIEEILKANPVPRCSLQLVRMTAFAGPKGDMVVLLARAPESLMEYRDRLVQRFGQEGIFVDAKPFRPHVTLVRAKKKGVWLDGIRFTPTVTPVERAVLFKSYPSGQKRIYEPLCTVEAVKNEE